MFIPIKFVKQGETVKKNTQLNTAQSVAIPNQETPVATANQDILVETMSHTDKTEQVGDWGARKHNHYGLGHHFYKKIMF